MENYSKNLLNKTIATWQPYSPTPLSQEDVREIIDVSTELINFLIELDKKYPESKEQKKEPNNFIPGYNLILKETNKYLLFKNQEIVLCEENLTIKLILT
ncbi:MAG: hypothetical protein KAV18_03875 [Candidatus Omnitrophica bacterium]|nr:hypothetical protein [Candidatus Omnitrophota bacterium]